LIFFDEIYLTNLEIIYTFESNIDFTHFLDPASLLKDVILLGGFICPEKILVIVELLELPIVGVFLLAGDRFYS
jgi:hypothetical protein